ncbi:sensor histidine kinase [Agromyces intestinalis]|uniref:sensor histidine kinase n=1 Tax=Agromyces intestinalis TaxID=2592652 RepID=UPI001FE7E7BC|nr:histidine kinase [Agromyces intestinalis]
MTARPATAAPVDPAAPGDPAAQARTAAPATASTPATPTARARTADDADWLRPRPTRTQVRNDVLLAVVLFAGTFLSTLLYRTAGFWEDPSPLWLAMLWCAGMALPLAARRVVPEIVALVLTAVFFAGAVAQLAEPLFSNIDLFIAIYTVGAWSRRRRWALITRVLIVVTMLVWLFWGLIIASNVPDHLPELSREADGGIVSPYVAFALINIVTNLLYFGGAWYFGDTAFRSARSRASLEQRTAELAAERERSRAQAVELERLRIARELHDVVAHHVSVIGVQAGAARRVLARDPEAAAASLTAIESSAREAIAELHGLLGTLRHGDSDVAEAAVSDVSTVTGPTEAVARGFADLAALADATTDAGVPTGFRVIGEPSDAGALVGLTAYRIAQEALTNVRKHAGAGATADLRVRWSEASVEVEVTDTGLGRATVIGGAGAPAAGGGLGQAGMRERVAAVGGELELGPRHRGGYLVRATLPLRRADAAASAAPQTRASRPDVSQPDASQSDASQGVQA